MKPLKFKKIKFNNKKRQLHFIYYGGREVYSHYGSFNIKKNIERIEFDKDTTNYTATFTFEDGSKNHMPYDIPLLKTGDPEAILYEQICEIIASIKSALKKKRISKAYLIDQLETSASQLDRLLDTQNLNKNLPQLYKIIHLLDLKPNFTIKVA